MAGMDQADAFGAPAPSSQAAAFSDPSGIAPREGPVVLDDGRHFMADKARRWPASVHSQRFGECVYLTARGAWVRYVPASFLDPPKVSEVKPEVALAWLLTEGFEAPRQLKAVAINQEV